MDRRKSIIAALLLLVLSNLIFAQAGIQTAGGRQAGPGLPNPKLAFAGMEKYSANGKHFIRFNLKVLNFAAYPNAMFAAAPGLPACGANANASRTWVDIFDANTGQRIYGFCALGESQDLTDLWFAVEVGKNPPHCVYIVMTDRKFHKKYVSNKVCIPLLGDPPKEGKPDLTVKGFAFGNDAEKSIKVHVRNVGNDLSGNCLLRLTVRKINGVPVGRTTEVKVPMLKKGSDYYLKLQAKHILPNNVALQDTTFRLNVDATAIVAESNETNNEVWHNLNK